MLAKFFAPLAMKVAAGIVLALAVALAITWWRADALAAERDRLADKLATAEATIALLEVDAALKDTASTEAAADSAAVASMERTLIDAIKDTPDSQPSAVRVGLGCQRLRNAGTAEPDLPEVCRPGG